MVEKRRRARTLSIIIGSLLLFFGWRVTVFCYSLDFPENFELLVSRCRDAEIVDVSPNGEHLVVRLEFPETKYWLINNVTKERFTLPHPGAVRYTFFADDQLFVQIDQDYYFWVISSQGPSKLETLDIDRSASGVETLTGMDRIIYLDQANRAIAVDERDEGQPPSRYVIINSQEPRSRFYDIQEHLLENEIAFEVISSSRKACRYDSRTGGCLSHNGQYLASSTAVTTTSGTLILEQTHDILPIRQKTSLKGWAGWTHDDSGLFFNFGHDYVIEITLVLLPSLINIPGGVGILKLPEQ